MNRADRQHPRCEGGAFYGEHEAKPLTGYTLIGPGGRVAYACDLDCLRRHVEQVEARLWRTVSAQSAASLRRGGR